MGSTREYGKLYPAAKAVVKPVVGFLWRLNVTGLDHVPVSGPAIFCPNHISFFDSVVLPSVLPRRISYVGKAEYMDSWKTKYVFPALGMIPISREGGSASQRALDTAASVLERGEFFGIYPEGTRSRDGKLHRGHTGPARLALRTGAPIVPVGLRGTDLIQPTGAATPKPFRTCQVNIGEPIDVSRYASRADDHLVLRQLIDEVMFEIRRLSGQDYVDTYANSKAEAAPAPEPPTAAPDGSVPTPAASPEPGRRTAADALSTSHFATAAPERVPVLPDGSVPEDDSTIDLRSSSADVLSRWWS